MCGNAIMLYPCPSDEAAAGNRVVVRIMALLPDNLDEALRALETARELLLEFNPPRAVHA